MLFLNQEIRNIRVERFNVQGSLRTLLPCPESSFCKTGKLSCLCNSNPAYSGIKE